MATIGNAISLLARKAAAFDFLAAKELSIAKSLWGSQSTCTYWLVGEYGCVQPGEYATPLEAVEAFMKDGEGR